VEVLACAREESLCQKAVERIRTWQGQGYDTIAVVCRDRKEAGEVSALLGREVTLSGEGEETANYENGVMVLPVEYTKGLEFDAVLLWDPSEEKYPSGDGHVKLLYVAATRALHELSVLHLGNLSGLIKETLPEGKKVNQSLEKQGDVPVVKMADGRTLRTEAEKTTSGNADAKTKSVSEVDAAGVRSQKERFHKSLEKKDAVPSAVNPSHSDAQNSTKTWTEAPTTVAHTNVIGQQYTGEDVRKQKQLTAAENERKKAGAMQARMEEYRKFSGYEMLPERINSSSYRFGDRPENGLLAPPPHAPIDLTIRRAQKKKSGLYLTSNYGILRIIPVTPEIIRVTFSRESLPPEQYCDGIAVRSIAGQWKCRMAEDAIELKTESLLLRIGKKDGAIRFYTKEGRLLLKERERECRQINPHTGRMWNFFSWEKTERIRALGVGKLTMPALRNNAFYISHGKQPLRLPAVFSDKGYEVVVAAENTVLGCNIPLYGSYFCTEGMNQIDYYFVYGDSEEELHTAYRYLGGNRPFATGRKKL
jgi:DNA helicase-2/ATP-dependent DNA helicase PcrA